MNKKDAINYINSKIGASLNNKNTIFSNPGSSLDLWWLEPNNEKFNEGFYFILNNTDIKKLMLFQIPKNTINKSVFRQRKEKGVSQIIIPISNKEFIDRWGFNFAPFLQNEISY
ncbi:MAG: hypothetical protein ABIN74_06755 [Ferruginibacter sp.]